MRELQLKGSMDSKFKQLETVITRIIRTQKVAKTVVERPLSVLSHYLDESPAEGPLFLCGLFKGRVRKILFSVQEIEGKEAPHYIATIGNETHQQQASVKSRKKKTILDINVDVADGDMLKLEMTTPDVKLKNVVMTALVEWDKGLVSKTEFDANDIVAELEVLDGRA